MSFGGDMNYSLVISARDETQGALASVKSGFGSLKGLIAKPIEVSLKLAQGGLGLLRDINLGLVPLLRGAVSGIDHLVERGGRLELVQKNFRSLFDVPNADAFARKLVNASDGALKLSEAMGIANKAVLADVGMKDIPTIFEFASRRAAAFGEDATSAIESIVETIHRGNFRFLKQLGIDVGDVADKFEEMSQGGKLSGLDFAARKAEVIAAAVAKMREQTTKFNITGHESLLVWTGLKNQISDSVDKLALAVVKNDSFKNAMTGFRDLFGGMAQHLEGGGSIWDVLFGKKDGKSGGMLGLLKAGLLDAGAALGRGILGGILLGISKIPELFGMVADTMNADFINKIGKILEVKPGPPMPGFGIGRRDDPALDPPKSWGIKRDDSVRIFDEEPITPPPTWRRATSQPATSQPSMARRLLVPGFSAAVGEPFGPSMETYEAYEAWKKARMRELDSKSWGGGGYFNQYGQWIDNFFETFGAKWFFGKMNEAFHHFFNPEYMKDQVKQMVVPGMVSYGGTPLFPGTQLLPYLMAQTATSQPSSGDSGGSAWYSPAGMKANFLKFAELSGNAGERLLSGGVFGGQSRLADEFGKVKADFPYDDGARLADWIKPSEFRFTMDERLKRKRQIARDKHDIARLERGESIEGGPSLRTLAHRDTNQYIRELRGQGRYVSPRTEQEIYKRRLAEIIEGKTTPLIHKIEGEEEEIKGSDARRELDRRGMLKGRRTWDMLGHRFRGEQSEEEKRRTVDVWGTRYADWTASSKPAKRMLDQLKAGEAHEKFDKVAEMGKSGFAAVRGQIEALIKAVNEVAAALVGEEGQLAAVGNRGK